MDETNRYAEQSLRGTEIEWSINAEEIRAYLDFMILMGINKLKQNFQAAYYPHCQVSIDEAMILFKGRSSMKQYVRLKPVKCGFKVWAMANALNGYVYNFNVYTEAGESSEREKGLGERLYLR